MPVLETAAVGEISGGRTAGNPIPILVDPVVTTYHRHLPALMLVICKY